MRREGESERMGHGCTRKHANEKNGGSGQQVPGVGETRQGVFTRRESNAIEQVRYGSV